MIAHMVEFVFPDPDEQQPPGLLEGSGQGNLVPIILRGCFAEVATYKWYAHTSGMAVQRLDLWDC